MMEIKPIRRIRETEIEKNKKSGRFQQIWDKQQKKANTTKKIIWSEAMRLTMSK